MAVQALRIGILADSSIQLGDLESLIVSAGYSVGACLQTRTSQLEKLLGTADWPEVDAWVARIDLHTDTGQDFIEWLDSLDVPVIYDDLEVVGNVTQVERVRRFSNKINMCAGSGVSSPLTSSRAKEVWVLAASAGGVEAVTAFLRHLPKNINEAAFFYVQHIDANISDTLKQAVIRNTDWRVFSCEKSHMICEGCLYIVSPNHQFDLSSTGVMIPIGDSWVGAFSPSVDQVMAKVARVYGKNSGAIIFSGMGEDGAKSCHYMKHSGGKIWTQSLDSCAVDSMPSSAQATGCVSYSAAAPDLATHFASRHMQTIQTGNAIL